MFYSRPSRSSRRLLLDALATGDLASRVNFTGDRSIQQQRPRPCFHAISPHDHPCYTPSVVVSSLHPGSEAESCRRWPSAVTPDEQGAGTMRQTREIMRTTSLSGLKGPVAKPLPDPDRHKPWCNEIMTDFITVAVAIGAGSGSSSMAGCDGWITIKIVELILSILCMIYKRVTDDEANKLFYFLQKYSREWPLLSNITWEENGAIFTDVTYGGFIIIVLGLIIGQCTGELQHHRKMESFFLVVGALMFISAGSLELAALDSVEERLVDNAAILGVVSLVTGFVFILDLLLAGKRRKKSRLATLKKKTLPKATQTTGEGIRSGDVNGNVHNGGWFSDEGTKKIPKNGVKILPSSPMIFEASSAPPLYTANDLKVPEARIRSTESFLRSEKGEYVRRSPPKDHVYVPPGFVLMPVGQLEDGKREATTPPGYTTIIADLKEKGLKTSQGYMVIPMEQDDGRKSTKTPNGLHREASQPSLSNLSLSDVSDLEDKPGLVRKYSQGRKALQDFGHPSRGRLNQAFDGDSDPSGFRRSSSRASTAEKPKSILRFDRIRLSSRKDKDAEEEEAEEEGTKGDNRYDSLDSRKIAEDLRHLKEITKSDLDLTQHELENENEMLKIRLRKEREESEKLKKGLKKQLAEDSRSYSQRKKLAERINELEDIERLLKLEKKVRDLEEEKARDDEKDRRMSEREEQYFGLLDLRQSQRGSSPVERTKMADIERSMREGGEGVKSINERLKKFREQEDKAKEDQEMRKIIDEGFYFLDEEERRRRRKNLRNQPKTAIKPSRSKSPSPPSGDSPASAATDDEIRLRIATPGGSSYKSEAQVWLGSDGEVHSAKESSASPTSPGFVHQTVHNWPETPSPSPHDRFLFSAKKAQKLKISKTPSPDTDDYDGPRVGQTSLPSRRVDFTELPRPATAIGSTNSWKKWLQPKPKFQHARSVPG